MLSDDDEESVQLLMSTRKHEILVMADNKHASGAAVLVIQDLFANMHKMEWSERSTPSCAPLCHLVHHSHSEEDALIVHKAWRRV
jgi:hypothetical protein